MLSVKKMEEFIGVVLLIGTLLSAVLVIIGGVMYLLQHGSENVQYELLQTSIARTTIKQIWQYAFSFTPLGIVELGLLMLVATQTVRVALLCWLFTMIRDYRFLMISVFILIMLIYSSFWRN